MQRYIFETFTTQASDGSIVELKPGGKSIPVTYVDCVVCFVCFVHRVLRVLYVFCLRCGCCELYALCVAQCYLHGLNFMQIGGTTAWNFVH